MDFFKNFLAKPSLKADNSYSLHSYNRRGGCDSKSRWVFSYETGSEVRGAMVFFYTYLLAVREADSSYR